MPILRPPYGRKGLISGANITLVADVLADTENYSAATPAGEFSAEGM